MKKRRVLAAILCAAMIFSSETFTMGTMAAESTAEVVIENVEEENVEENAGEVALPKETEDAVETEEPVTEEVEEGAEEATSSPEATEQPAASQVPEETPAETEAPEEAEQPTPSEMPEALPTETPEIEEVPTEEPTQTPEEMEISSPTPEVTEEVSPTPSQSPDVIEENNMDEIEADQASAEVLGVDEDGVLYKIGTSSFPSTLIIPDEAKVIPAGLFQNDSTVKEIKFDNDGANSQLVTIEAGAFSGSVLQTITIPAGVTVIADETFKNSALTSITIKGAVTSIGEEAFMNTGLTSFVAPAALKEIGESAFASCTNLRTLNMNNLEVIGDRAFQGCTSLTDGGIGWSKKLSKIGNYAFAGCSFTSLSMASVNSDGSTEEVTIGVGAFSGCASLTKIVLPVNVKTLSNSIFKGCTALVDVALPEELTTISSFAFSGCTALSQIDIPSGVSRIEAKAFENCKALTEIVINYPDPEADVFYIAEDAFPSKSDVTMKGYDGKVQDYAEKMGYTFVSLYKKYSMKSGIGTYAELQAVAVSGKLEVADGAMWAVPGTEIKITVVPKSGYCLREGTLKAQYEDSSKYVEPELVSCTEEKQVFTFIMPEANVSIKAEFDEADKAVSGTLGYRLDKVNEQPVDADYNNNKVIINRAGQQAQLVVYGTKTVGSWLLNYSSNNKSVATISDTGLITAKGAGTATIKATLKSDTKQYISFTLTVSEDTEITEISLSFSGIDRATKKTETIDGEEYTIIEYEKSKLSTENKKFKVELTAKDADGYSLVVDSQWTTADKNVAAVGQSKSSTNSNEITVKKGTEGEAIITVTVPNKDEEKDPCKASFIVRVIDATPRLAETKVTVNSLSEAGTQIDIVPVYGYEINHEVGLSVCKKVTSGSVVTYVPFSGLRVDYDAAADEYRLVATGELEISSGKSVTYKDNSKLYITGEYDNVGGTFRIPVETVVVENKPLNPTVKLKGKINLFFNSTASAEEQGSVTITQSLTKETVKEYKLVSEENHKKADSQVPDKFANNFVVDEEGVITRSSNEMMQTNKKDVVKGYLYIYYEGYTEPVVKQITVPTCTTKPKYELSVKSATVNELNENPEFELQILDKSVKGKPAISLANLDAEEGLGFDYVSGTTEDLFKNLDISSAAESDIITLKVDGTPKKGKAVINVKMSTWSQYLQFTFNLKVNTSLPTAKLSASSVSLNNLCLSQEGVLKVTLNQSDAQVAGFTEAEFVGKSALAEEAEKIAITTEGNEIHVTLTETVKKGDYKFKITPSVMYEEGDDYPLNKALTFTVKVNNTTPTMKLKSSTFTLNASYPGTEVVSTSYTISGLPTGSTYEIDDSSVELVPTSSKTAAAAAKIADALQFSYEDGALSVSLTDGKYTKFSYGYTVKGLKVRIGASQDEVTIKDFKITVKGNKTEPSISVKSKGTLNPIDAESSITYTGTVKNIKSDIANVTIREYKENGTPYQENGVYYSPNFELDLTELDSNVVSLKAASGVTLNAKKTYKIKLEYELTACPGKKFVTGFISIKPKQSLPKIKTDKSSAYLYAGQNRPKTVDVEITKVDAKGKVTEAGGVIEKVEFASGTSETIKKAFKVSYDPSTGKMTLQLVNPAILVLNKTYTINLEAKYVNQMENTTGSTFKLKVKVCK